MLLKSGKVLNQPRERDNFGAGDCGNTKASSVGLMIFVIQKVLVVLFGKD
jgi:hypothetical protein